MPPTRWLSMSASVSSLMRSQFSSMARNRASARSWYSRSVITMRRMFGWLRILGSCSGPARVMALSLVLSGLVACGQRGPLYLPPAKTPESTPKPANAPARLPDTTPR
ncbi:MULTISPECIES: lipoprotein [Hydrogenophaga]|uniref:LPS translocon maturation chaperone LptM n=1 Tax=Hydrogenophaga TaxID=47420 RepID=UPI0030020F20